MSVVTVVVQPSVPGKRAGMPDVVPVSKDTDMAWLRLQEEQRYQETAEALSVRLDDMNGASVTPPASSSLDYLCVDGPL